MNAPTDLTHLVPEIATREVPAAMLEALQALPSKPQNSQAAAR